MSNPIFLIGMRGSGKTTLSQRVCAYYPEKRYIDLDEELIQREGRSISRIICTKGFGYFRHYEEKLLLQYQKTRNTIISTGGGIIVSKKNRALLRKEYTIFIDTPIEHLLERLTKDPQKNLRPSLTKLPLKEELLSLWEERRLLYLRTAQYRFYAISALEKNVHSLYLYIKRNIPK
ncbi:MAG: shikimate kinase [Desulfovibrionaceae bacterium]